MANETNEVNVTGGSVRTGKTVDVTLRITAKDLWMFSMYHANAGFMGMFNLIFSLAALYLLIFRWSTTTVPYRCLLVVCALILRCGSLSFSGTRPENRQSAGGEESHAPDL